MVTASVLRYTTPRGVGNMCYILIWDYGPYYRQSYAEHTRIVAQIKYKNVGLRMPEHFLQFTAEPRWCDLLRCELLLEKKTVIDFGMKILVSCFTICILLSTVTSNKLLKDTGQGNSEEQIIFKNPSEKDHEGFIVKVVPAQLKVQGTANEREHLEVQGTSGRVGDGIKKTGEREEEEKGFLEKNAEYCRLRHNLLDCNFNGKELVSVKDFAADEGIEILLVRNASQVFLLESVCYDLVLEDIGYVLVEGRLPSDCPGGKVLAMRNVSLNRLPEAVNSVSVFNSFIEEMALHVADTFLVKESKIGSLDVSTTLKSEVTVTINQTEVGLVQKLRVSDRSALFLSNCTFGSMRKHAVVLGSGKHVVRDVIIKHPSSTAPNIGLRGEAEVTFTDLTGSMKIVHESCSPAVHETPCSQPPLRDIASSHSSVHSVTEKSNERDSVSTCVIIQSGKNFENCQMFVILFTFSVFLNIVQLLFNQPRELLMKMFRIESSVSGRPGSSRPKRDSTLSEDGDVPFLPDTNIVGRKRGASFPGDSKAVVENGDPFSNPVFVSEIQMVDERRSRTYRHSLSADSKDEVDTFLPKDEADIFLSKDEAESKKPFLVPRRRIRSSNSS
ncbi:uncharacterized protein LOC134771259 [Penaeus indicus]|uniref:uncharacterized protein LOC134771259 n=1 Tax=Penaeus indicus TaxID=29960 RepID=UPI00300D3C4B